MEVHNIVDAMEESSSPSDGSPGKRWLCFQADKVKTIKSDLSEKLQRRSHGVERRLLLAALEARRRCL